MSDTINIKESLLEVVNKNNLEILKIDVYNDDESFARYCGRESDVFCETYTTLEDLDFNEDSMCWHDEVQGIVYCQDKNTKEPVWITSRGDEGSSWWEVSRVPTFYKNPTPKKIEQVRSLLEIAFTRLDTYNKGGATKHNLLWQAMGSIEDALNELGEQS